MPPVRTQERGTKVLELSNVMVRYSPSGPAAIDDVSLVVDRGDRVGIVGESGSGKSTLASTILRSLPGGSLVEGTITYAGQDITAMPESRFRPLRSVEIARIPQDPLASLSPVLRVGTQLRDVVRAHRSLPNPELIDLIERALTEVGIPEPNFKRRAFPHELSGGMRQRVLIAMSLINEPRLLIADEPTTALDVTVQAQIIDLLQQEFDRRNMTLLLITHDIGVVAELCDRIVVMRHGRVIEEGDITEVMAAPQHPYTRELFAAASMRPEDFVTATSTPMEGEEEK